MKIGCISDTHTFHREVKVDAVDLLLHAGDFTGMGSKLEVTSFLDWFADQEATHKVCIAGNHDFFCEHHPEEMSDLCSELGITYLFDESFVADDEEGFALNIYGSPYQPRFGRWAFNLGSNKKLAKVWAKVPEDVDILLTHCPAYGTLDIVDRIPGHRVGCKELANRIKAVTPSLHVFGHIHEAYGTDYDSNSDLWSCNASICTLSYRPTNPATYFEYDGNEFTLL